MNIRAFLSIVLGGVSVLLTGCTSPPKGITPVSGFEDDRYLGKWYEIARLDHSFERGLDRVTAEYTKRDDKRLWIINRGYNTQKQQWSEATGQAKKIGKEDVGSFKVSFFGPFYAGYHVISLDTENYQWAMVTSNSRKYLWILSREKTLDEIVMHKLILQAQTWGYNTDELIYPAH